MSEDVERKNFEEGAPMINRLAEIARRPPRRDEMTWRDEVRECAECGAEFKPSDPRAAHCTRCFYTLMGAMVAAIYEQKQATDHPGGTE